MLSTGWGEWPNDFLRCSRTGDWVYYQRLGNGSAVSREVHAAFCERPRVRFPRSTLPNVYVKSKAAGERVLASLSALLESRLHLKINRSKSAVGRPWERSFLGYSFTSHHKAKLKVAPQSVQRFRQRLREHCRRGRGRRLATVITDLAPLLRGWINYFRLSEVKGVFEELDMWLRRRLRAIVWRQWKRPRTRRRMLMHLGLGRARAIESSTNGRGPWWNAGASHMNQALPTRYFRNLGLLSLIEEHQRVVCST